MLQTSWIVLEPYLGQRRYTVQETRQSTVPFPQNQVLIYRLSFFQFLIEPRIDYGGTVCRVLSKTWRKSIKFKSNMEDPY